MARTTEFEPNVIPLQGGLNKQSPKFAANPGELSECLNFEVTDVSGYTRCEGFARYDGDSFDARDEEAYAIILRGTANVANIGDGLDLSLGSTVIGTSVGFIKGAAETKGDLLWFTQVGTPDLSSIVGEIVSVGTAGITFSVEAAMTQRDHFNDIRITRDKTTTQRGFIDASNILQQDYNSLREPIFPRFGTRDNTTSSQITPHGLFFYRDDLYAVVNHYVVEFENAQRPIRPNQVLRFKGSTREFKVIDARLLTGNWGEPNTGLIMITFLDQFPNTAAVSDVPEDIQTQDGLQVVAVATQVRDFPEGTAWGAGLYVAREDGTRGNKIDTPPVKRWYPVDMGWKVDVKGITTDEGQVVIPVLFRGKPDDDALTRSSTNEVVFGTATAGLIATGGTVQQVLSDNDNATYVSAPPTWGNTVLTNASLPPIPPDAIITGITVKATFTASWPGVPGPDPLGGAIAMRLVGPGPLASSSEFTVSFIDASFTNEVVDFGDASFTWGIDPSDITLENVLDPAFGVRMAISAGSYTHVRVSRVRIIVHYRKPISNLYFWNGQTDVVADITNVHIDDGDPDLSGGGDGVGRFYLYNVKPHGSGTRQFIDVGDEVRTEDNGGGDLVAVCSSSLAPVTLPTREEMQRAGTQLRTITANFYAVDDWEAVYGCTGVGMAFSLDSFYFTEIRTGLRESDRPRHVAFFQNHLALGFSSGTVRLSVVGEPTNFSGVDGAFETGVGDRITGLLPLNGETLGVFCASSIHSIFGRTLDDFQQRVIVPDHGCIEYSLVHMGEPLFLDYRGVSTIQSSDKYGDFQWGRLSDNIYPLIRSRVQGRRTQILNPTNFYTAYAVRNKNQVRFVFEDGVQIVMTLGQGFRPEFTIMNYAKYEDSEFSRDGNLPPDRNGYVPLAVCTGVNSPSAGRDRGRDRVFMTLQGPYIDVVPVNPGDAVTEDRAIEERLDFVFEVDIGNYFDDWYIYSYLQTDYAHFGDVFVEKALQRIDVQALYPYSIYYRILAGTDFSDARDRVTNASVPSLGTTPKAVSGADFLPTLKTVPVSLMSQFSKTGMNLSIMIDNPPPFVYNGVQTTNGTPPFTLQAMAIQFQPKRGDR